MRGVVVGLALATVSCAAVLVILWRTTPGGDAASSAGAAAPAVPTLDQVRDAVDARAGKKAMLVDRLVGGEVTLAEAARAYLALNREWPVVPADRYDGYPGRTLGERVAHVLADGVEIRVRDDPRRAAVLDRLACELAALAHLAPGWERDGPVPGPTKGAPRATGFMLLRED